MSHPNKDLEHIIKETGVYQCLDCGKCTGACPVAETGKVFSPRLAASRIIEKGDSDPYVQEFVWACLTCGRCDDRCPSGVRFSDFVRLLRCRWIDSGKPGVYSHGGAMLSLMRMMSSPHLRQNRKSFLPSEINTVSRGKVLYFTGCLPYFDVFFKNLDLNMVQMAADSLKILNRCDIEPVVLNNERCCGHDLFWAGDQRGFAKLAKESYEEIKDHGVQEVITSCPECFYTFKEIFPQVLNNFDLKVTHIYESIEDRLIGRSCDSKLKPLDLKVSFKDSCRLNFYKDISQIPRKILERIKGLNIRETSGSQIGDICCGNSAWVGCGGHSKIIQMKRLRETLDTGSQLLVTSCPKCLIHLQCTIKDFYSGEKLEIKDMVSLLAVALD